MTILASIGKSGAGLLALISLQCAGLAAGPETDQLISPSLPADLNARNGGAPQADIEQAARFAWQVFLGLNWPAAANRRGIPDKNKDFGAADGVPRVWETFRARVEAYPGTGSPTDGIGAEGDYGFDATPRYIYDPGKVTARPGNAPGTIPACSPANGSDSSVPWHNLDEPDHGNTRSGLSPKTPFPGQQVLLESKVNRDHYTYVASRGWYGDQPIRLAKKKTGDFVRGSQEAPPPASPSEPDDKQYISFPNGAMELKAAWRRLGPHDDAGHYFMSRVRYYEPRDGAICHQDSAGRSDGWGLLAMHVMYKTPSAPYFIWATFEQVETLVANRLDEGGHPIPMENPDGSNAARGESPSDTYTPGITITPATEDEDQVIDFSSTTSSPDGPQLYFVQEGEYGLPGIEHIGINQRLHPIPAAIVRANQVAQSMIRTRYPDSPFQYYRLVSVQWKPLDKVAGRPYSGPDDPAVYYASNVVIEPSPVQQGFSGQFTSGFARASDYLHKTMLFINPQPNPRAPVFLNTFYHGQGSLSGGCMGCHGFRQAYGTDWSFLIERQRVLAPEIKE